MARYLALLRGVNVGGVAIRMTDLAAVFRDLGYAGVRTVLASGNVVFETDATAAAAKTTIEAALRRRFGYEAWVHVLESAQVRRIVSQFPFDTEREGWHAYVIFLLAEEPRRALLALQSELDPALESVAAGDGVVYWTVQKGHTLHSTVGRASGKPRFKPLLTTRNLRTLTRMLD